MAIVRVENLTKEFQLQKRKSGFIGSIKDLLKREYETKVAVNNISFEIEKGEIIGYIGPNGAGKSTTIKMMVGILVPTNGHVDVYGIVPYKNRIDNARKIGVVFGQRTQLWWDIPVSESFNLMKYMYRIPDDLFQRNMRLFSEILGISQFFNVPVRQLSLGQRMRADLCAALLHNPDIIFLDEPTIGLDVVVKESIREFIKEINKTRQTTIILTTHDMSDIEKLCSRVIIIDHGTIMYDGNLEQLKNKYGTEEILIADIEGEVPDFNSLYDMRISEVKYETNKLFIKYDRRYVNSTQVIGWLMNRCKIKDFIVNETEIEEVIGKIYKGKLSDRVCEVSKL